MRGSAKMVWRIEGGRCDGNFPFKLILAEAVTLGRTRDSPAPLASLHVSRRQCRISPSSKKAGFWAITDLKSCNGTHLNGELIPANVECDLKAGDKVKVGLEAEDPTQCFEFEVKVSNPSDTGHTLLSDDDSSMEAISQVAPTDPRTRDATVSDRLPTVPYGKAGAGAAVETKETPLVVDPRLSQKPIVVLEPLVIDADVVVISSDDDSDSHLNNAMSPVGGRSPPGDQGLKRTSSELEEGELKEEEDLKRMRVSDTDSDNSRRHEADELDIDDPKDDEVENKEEDTPVVRPKKRTVEVNRRLRINSNVLRNKNGIIDDSSSNSGSSSSSEGEALVSLQRRLRANVRKSLPSPANLGKRKVITPTSSPRPVSTSNRLRVARKSISRTDLRARMLVKQARLSARQDMDMPRTRKPSDSLREQFKKTNSGMSKVVEKNKAQGLNSYQCMNDLGKARLAQVLKSKREQKVTLPVVHKTPTRNKTISEADSQTNPFASPSVDRVRPRPAIAVKIRQTKAPLYTDTNYDVKAVIERKRESHKANLDLPSKPIVPWPSVKPVIPVPTLTAKIDKGSLFVNPARKPMGTVAETSRPIPNPGPSILLKDNVKNIMAGKRHVVKNSISTYDGMKPISIDPYILEILEWKAQWFKEFKKSNQEPHLTSKPLVQLKPFYETVDDYISSYIPLIYHEIWANLMENYAMHKENKLSAKQVRMVAVNHYEIRSDFLSLACQLAITTKDFKEQQYPGEGDLVILELNIDGKEQEDEDDDDSNAILSLGYVNEVIIDEVTKKSTAALNYEIPKDCTKLVRYTIKSKARNVRLDQKKLMRIIPLLYAKPQIRLIEAVISLKKSLLSNDILKPRLMTCQMAVPTSVKVESPDFNESQYKAILGSIEALKRAQTIPKLLLIQGPPGTGKTYTLIGIIKNIFLNWDDPQHLPKLLICAPSNGAVDEIGLRLYRERDFLSKGPKYQRSLRLVRIGQVNSVHPEFRKMSLDELVENNLNSTGVGQKKALDLKIQDLEKKIACLDMSVADLRASGTRDQLVRTEDEMEKLNKEMTRLRLEKEFVSTNNIESRRRGMRADVLRKADVIMSTLNSCRQLFLENIYKSDRDGGCAFNCVIVDEASQCSEPEILMPLTFPSISKMILIGDPMQLPATVKSKVAASYGYGRSLFERFFNYFGGYKDASNPVLMLERQYRMHPEICNFPANRFYAGRLQSHSQLGLKWFPLRPYAIIDVQDSQQNTNDPKNVFNDMEAAFIINICKVIAGLVKPQTSVGIITPYQGQKRLLSCRLAAAKLNLKADVNTIDGFQGQERDIIVVSCVRAQESGSTGGVGFLSSTQRMNVALTRAKHSLIVCVSAKALEGNQDWAALINNATQRHCLFKAPSTSKPETIKKLIYQQPPDTK